MLGSQVLSLEREEFRRSRIQASICHYLLQATKFFALDKKTYNVHDSHSHSQSTLHIRIITCFRLVHHIIVFERSD